MIEISTPTTNSLQNNMPQNSSTVEDLDEEEQSFYALIQNKLNAMLRNPSQATISKILNYSKSV